MRHFICVLLIIACSIAASAAVVLTGNVSDESGAPIPYAKVSIPAKGDITLTDSAGLLHYRLAALSPADTIIFSSIGYEPYAVSYKDFKTHATVTLKDNPNRLHEVTVLPAKTKEKTFGRTSMKGAFEIQVGSEHSEGTGIGVHCKTGKRGWITSVSMGWLQRPGCLDRMPFRLNIYSKVNGKWVNVTEQTVIFTYLKEKLNDEGRFVYKLPEPVMISGDTMVEFEFLEPMRGRGLYIKSNVMTGHFYFHNKKDQWESIPVGGSFAVHATVEK